MKKLASIIGVGVLSMAVGFAPAFAQQTKPMDNAGSTATVQPKTDEKASAANPAAKDEKGLHAKPDMKAKTDTTRPAKTGTDVKSENVPAKSGTDVKATSSATVPAKPDMKAKTDTALPAKTGREVKSENVPAKSGTDVKASSNATVPAKPDMKAKTDTTLPAKTGTDVKSENVPVKSPEAVKSGSLPGKSEMGAKDDKASAVKPVADLKSEKAVRSHHARHNHIKHEAAGKLSSSKAGFEKHHHMKTASAVSKDADRKVEKGNSVNPGTGN